MVVTGSSLAAVNSRVRCWVHLRHNCPVDWTNFNPGVSENTPGAWDKGSIPSAKACQVLEKVLSFSRVQW
jgi:hypothetical protein